MVSNYTTRTHCFKHYYKFYTFTTQSKILTSSLWNGCLISQCPWLISMRSTEFQCSKWPEQLVKYMSNTAMCWPVVTHSNAVINAVIYWPVRQPSPHLAEAWEGQFRLSTSPEGKRAVIWAAFKCPGPTWPPTGMYRLQIYFALRKK